MLSGEEIIALLGLEPHPEEGGYYKETYRSGESLGPQSLPSRYGGARSFSTAIYYLLTPETFSAMHRIITDEIFHFYLGDPVLMLLLHPDRRSETIILGQDLREGHQPQVAVPAGAWQGCSLVEGGRFALMGTTVAPGFDFADYEAGKRDDLIRRFPDRADLIARLTPATS